MNYYIGIKHDFSLRCHGCRFCVTIQDNGLPSDGILKPEDNYKA